jgi:hypothetical protein
LGKDDKKEQYERIIFIPFWIARKVGKKIGWNDRTGERRAIDW